MNTKKGFTIIELLVVVAIIAVLTGIVLVNVTSYINKGKDAAIKGNIASLLTDSAVSYDSTGNYNSMCDVTTGPGLQYYKPIKAAIDSAYGAGSTVTCTCDTAAPCAATATKWCVAALLKSGATFCADSTGSKKEAVGETCAAGVCS